jgi:malate dehydrogenase (oxaloacetate-decarboxylating)
MDIFAESVELHKKLQGKLSVVSKKEIKDTHDLSLLYTPGVAEPCRQIHADREKVYELTIKQNTVAVISDGSAVLGLGNIGPEAAMPVMEGKAVLFKEYADIDAFPLCLNTQDSAEIIKIVKAVAPTFGGVNLEDIAAPRCFEIEDALQDIGIPVFHDDQHGTAIVLMAAVINAAKLLHKELSDLTIAINGAGAAGTATVEFLLASGEVPALGGTIGDVIICDSKGIVSKDRADIANNPVKLDLANRTNKTNRSGTLADALQGADIFIGLSKGNLVTAQMIKTMAAQPVVFAMANPTPEIMPDEAKSAGAFIVGTGRSDFPNQINNVLAFPGVFRGALDVRATKITKKMKFAAALALANSVQNLSVDEVLPSPLDKSVPMEIAKAVAAAWKIE